MDDARPIRIPNGVAGRVRHGARLRLEEALENLGPDEVHDGVKRVLGFFRAYLGESDERCVAKVEAS